jgi:hypothetical protein
METACENVNWFEQAQGRTQWWDFVNTVGFHHREFLTCRVICSPRKILQHGVSEVQSKNPSMKNFTGNMKVKFHIFPIMALGYGQLHIWCSFLPEREMLSIRYEDGAPEIV